MKLKKLSYTWIAGAALIAYAFVYIRKKNQENNKETFRGQKLDAIIERGENLQNIIHRL